MKTNIIPFKIKNMMKEYNGDKRKKAKELVDRFYTWTSRGEKNRDISIYDAKQCALICIDRERQAELRGLLFFHTLVNDKRMDEVTNKIIDEYKELKKEIEKL